MTDWLKPENRFNARPMDLLKQGIEQRQWEAVEACYLMLTGTSLTCTDVMPVAEVPPEPSEVVVAPPQARASGMDDEPGIHRIDRKSTKLYARRKSVKIEGRVMNHLDTGEFKDEVKWNPTTPPPNTHRPPAPAPVTIRCQECGKTEKVDPILGRRQLTRKYKMKYRCDECIVGGRSSGSVDDDVLDDDMEE